MSASLIAAATPALGSLFGLIDSLFTTEDERMAAKLKIMELEMSGQLAQMKVNEKQAQHKSIFIAGGRPAMMWVCVAAFAWTFVIAPFVTFTLLCFGIVVPLPVIDLSVMLPVLLGMLGLTTSRTFEKINGVAAETMEVPGVDRRASAVGG